MTPFQRKVFRIFLSDTPLEEARNAQARLDDLRGN
jgi:hypothetical protein